MKTSAPLAMLLLAVSCGPELDEASKLNTNLSTNPSCKGDVRVALSSVTLANDCPDVAAASSALLAPCQEDDETCKYDALCRQTSMQLSFDSTLASVARVEIRAVRLYNFDTRSLVDTLISRDPSLWHVDKYIFWNERVAAGALIKASYKLSAPDYSKAFQDSRLAFPMKFLVEVDVAIDGKVQTLSIEAQREPEVAT